MPAQPTLSITGETARKTGTRFTPDDLQNNTELKKWQMTAKNSRARKEGDKQAEQIKSS